MRTTLQYLLFFTVILIMVGCASYKTQYSAEGRNWQQQPIDATKVPVHTMYLIGDAGNDSPETPAPVLKFLKAKLAKEGKSSSAIFLGDNIYEYGMPPKEKTDEREVAEYRITSQLQTLDSFKGRPVFLPGNHDWRGWGLKGLKRQEKFVETYLNSRHGKTDKEEWENYFLPDNGCSGAEVVELDGDVVLLVIDSEWWMRDWDKESGMNDGCEVKNRAQFKFVFENLMRKYRSKRVVVAMHHPLYTYGTHGGASTVKQHFFPLTDINPKLYVPLPVIGTLSVLYRSTIGSRQDVANQNYQEFRAALLSGAKKNGNFIFASGHEHALQYIEREGQSMVVSGSGSKTSALNLGKGSQFASGKKGFSTLSFYEGGETRVQFWEVNTDGTDASLVFQKMVKEKSNEVADMPDSAFADYAKHADTAYKPIITKHVESIGGFHKFMLGEHHRNLYKETYPFPVLDLSKFQGGVTATKLGGGNQTNSLRVRDSAGRDFVLRGMDKDVSRFLPFPFNQITAAKFIVEDNFFSTHAFAPLAVPGLANAINVYHTNPKLYYVPMQPALGDYNTVFGNAVSLVEERPNGKNWKVDGKTFGNPDKIIGTDDLLENILDNSKHKVDESWLLRSRFLDFLIGDWDRHDDQWQWATFNQKDGTKLYRPVPRDRDQAFSKYDGFAVSLAHFTLPFMRQLQIYGPQIYNYKWNTWSARLVDRTFLTELDWPQWEEQVKFVQQNLTDAAIDSAFNAWPAKARELSAAHIIKSIKARRDNLMVIARAHYEFMNKSVDVLGTEERERFLVERLDDHHTKVTSYELSKKGELKQQNYQRVFDNNITKAINIYGNGDDDEFLVSGDVSKGIKVRLIGGMGKDLFVDSAGIKGLGRKTIVYDDLGKNTVVGSGIKDKRTSRYRFNVYDRRSAASEYNIVVPLPLIGFNPDDGILVGLGFNMIRQGFKKEPYASQQRFGASFAFATQGFRLDYTGDFISTFRNLDFYLDAHYKGPTFSFNYAGLGNDSKRPLDDANYYRVRQSELRIFPAVKKRLGSSGFVALGPTFSLSDIQATAGRFITSGNTGLSSDIFDTKYYAGGQLLLNFNSVDNPQAPHSGVRFYSGLSYSNNLKDGKDFGNWTARFSFYKPLGKRENFVLASQVGTGINIGNGYEFFQMPTIGGNQGLRGFRTERFYGKSSLWHSTDLRIRFGSNYNRTLPYTLGMFGSFDYGRVWLPKTMVDSPTWSYDYGGGLWVAPVDVLTLSLGAFVPSGGPEEKLRVVLRMGFGF